MLNKYLNILKEVMIIELKENKFNIYHIKRIVSKKLAIYQNNIF